MKISQDSICRTLQMTDVRLMRIWFDKMQLMYNQYTNIYSTRYIDV